MVAMLGPSGSGKSTLLSILGTLMRPTSGSFQTLGRALTTLPERELSDFRNQQIGFIFQYHHLLPDFTALENVMFPDAGRLWRETRAGRERAGDAARARRPAGADEAVRASPQGFRGQKRSAWPSARAPDEAQPALVLADEPTGNLDRENADQAFALMTEIQRETGTTLPALHHDRELAERCERRVYVEGGVVVDVPQRRPELEPASGGPRAANGGRCVPCKPCGAARVIAGDVPAVIDHTIPSDNAADRERQTAGVTGHPQPARSLSGFHPSGLPLQPTSSPIRSFPDARCPGNGENEMTQPFFTVVMPTRDRPDQMINGIASVFQQDFTADYEFVLRRQQHELGDVFQVVCRGRPACRSALSDTGVAADWPCGRISSSPSCRRGVNTFSC
jgi:lipoprotein-releasing system ATP-binding protein